MSDHEIDPDADDRPMVRELLSLRRKMDVLHDEIYQVLLETKKTVENSADDSSLLCDVGYIFKDMADIADNIRKMTKQRSELVGSIIAYAVTVKSMMSSKANLKVKGRYSRGTPDCKKLPRMPKKGTDEWRFLMKEVGVPDHLIDGEVVKPSFEGVSNLIQKLAAEGKDVPKGLVGTFPVYETKFARLPGVMFPKERK